MDSISDVFFKEKVLLVNVNHEGCINASFVTYSKYSGYVWLADADIDKIQLDKFPCVLEYLQHSVSSLELSYLNNTMITAKITSLQRDGGYKEPFHRVVEHSCDGYECLNNLENILAIQLKSKNQINGSFEKRLFKKIVPSKKESSMLSKK